MKNHLQSPGATSTATYTTIPISLSDVISRSLHNLTATLSRHLRPWPDLLGSGFGSFSWPDSLLSHARTNVTYFRANYFIIVTVASAISLIGSPFSLLLCSLVFAFWLVLYFFREDPLVLWGHSVSDRVMMACLAVASVFTLWFCGVAKNLLFGLGFGLLICGIHAVLRNSDGLFLDENDAASTGLVRSSGSPN